MTPSRPYHQARRHVNVSRIRSGPLPVSRFLGLAQWWRGRCFDPSGVESHYAKWQTFVWLPESNSDMAFCDGRTEYSNYFAGGSLN